MSRWSQTLLWAGVALGAAFASGQVWARSGDDCQLAWSRAVRSYLTQNRKAGPDGKVPANLDEAELASQAWAKAFAPACTLEAEGKKGDARVEAAMIGAQLLSKLDPRGCAHFMESYMQSEKSKDVCDMAPTASTQDLRAKISGSIPAR